jgi:hypothetical protein
VTDRRTCGIAACAREGHVPGVRSPTSSWRHQHPTSRGARGPRGGDGEARRGQGMTRQPQTLGVRFQSSCVGADAWRRRRARMLSATSPYTMTFDACRRQWVRPRRSSSTERRARRRIPSIRAPGRAASPRSAFVARELVAGSAW